MKYPTKVKHPNGEYYPINTSYTVGLRCMSLIDSDVSPKERTYGVLTMLFGKDAPKDVFMLDKAVLYLQRGEELEVQKTRVHDIDIVQDLPLIAISIETQFPAIDIREKEIHFWKFIDLIESLNGTLINNVREIRTTKLSDIKDPKHRRNVEEAQKRYKLKGKEVAKPTLAELMNEIEGGETNG
nr:Gp15 family bacteriophage protein [Erysipelothrix sp. HDW6C]